MNNLFIIKIYYIVNIIKNIKNKNNSYENFRLII